MLTTNNIKSILWRFINDIIYPIKSEITEERKINPKRMQREINNQLQNKGMGTKAQQALKLQHEQNKMERKVKSKEQREVEKERQYALRQEKRKAKHRGK